MLNLRLLGAATSIMQAGIISAECYPTGFSLFTSPAWILSSADLNEKNPGLILLPHAYRFRPAMSWGEGRRQKELRTRYLFNTKTGCGLVYLVIRIVIYIRPPPVDGQQHILGGLCFSLCVGGRNRECRTSCMCLCVCLCVSTDCNEPEERKIKRNNKAK